MKTIIGFTTIWLLLDFSAAFSQEIEPIPLPTADVPNLSTDGLATDTLVLDDLEPTPADPNEAPAADDADADRGLQVKPVVDSNDTPRSVNEPATFEAPIDPIPSSPPLANPVIETYQPQSFIIQPPIQDSPVLESSFPIISPPQNRYSPSSGSFVPSSQNAYPSQVTTPSSPAYRQPQQQQVRRSSDTGTRCVQQRTVTQQIPTRTNRVAVYESVDRYGRRQVFIVEEVPSNRQATYSRSLPSRSHVQSTTYQTGAYIPAGQVRVPVRSNSYRTVAGSSGQVIAIPVSVQMPYYGPVPGQPVRNAIRYRRF